MKRDMELVRSILLYIEEHDDQSGYRSHTTIKLNEYSEKEIGYHLKLLCQANLIEDYVWPDAAKSLTWDGHEFLDAIRNDAIWEKVKNSFIDKGAGLVFEVVKRVAIELTFKQVFPSNT